MHAPLYSTITLFAELVISGIIYFTIYQGYKHNRFFSMLAGFALLYEICFNISYMVSRVPEHAKFDKVAPAVIIVFAIVHGVLSLLMFLALIVFFVFAFFSYRKGNNFFQKHKILTTIFLIFWTFSIVSGIIFYLLEYIV